MYTSEELRSNESNSQRMREKRRVKVRQYVKGRPRGRPIRNSGKYYTRPVLITDRLMLKIRRARLPGEPLGSALERLVGLAEQKNPVAPIESYQPELPIVENDELWNKVWAQQK